MFLTVPTVSLIYSSEENTKLMYSIRNLQYGGSRQRYPSRKNLQGEVFRQALKIHYRQTCLRLSTQFGLVYDKRLNPI